MSKLFDDPRPHHPHHGEPEQEPMVSSILWMLTVRLTGILIVGIILGIIIYRRVPRGRNALWRLLKSTKAEAHMHAVVAGQDKDGYDVWRTSTSSSVQDSYGIKPDEMCIKDGELKGLLYAPNKDVLTLKDLLLHVADKYKGARALGQRKLIKEHKEKKTIHGEEREWTSYEKGPYEWLTYHEVLTHVKQLSCGLLALGLRPRESVCLFLDTCMEWQLMAHACFHSNLPVATAYASLGKKGLSHALAQTEGRALLTHASLFSTVLKSLKKCETLQYVFYVGEPDKHELEALEQALIKRAQKAADVESRVITFDKLLKIGKYNVSTVAEDPKPDDVALVMYTSGATGTPKGVLLSHANFVASVAGYAADLESCFDPTTDKYLAYLPLAHVLEFTVEQAALYLGIPIGYGNPRTLTDASMKNSKGDAKELQPTIMAGVPEVFERIRKTVEGQVIKQGGIAKHLFSAAFAFRRKLIDFNTDVPFVDQVLFRRVKAELGGKLKLVASGAAPLSKNNQMFLRACLGVQVIQGYALTETAGAGTLQANDDPTFSNVGRPNMCCEIKLVDVPKMGYTTDDEEGPAGEILIRGPNVSRGYLYLEDKTKEDFKDGWFSTGDIGRWIEGRLYIIDRKKNLVKLSSGEYIALEKLETLYKESSMVQNVMIHANTEENLLVAVVQPKKGNDDEDALLSEFESIAKKNQLSRVERVARVIVDTEEWTPENGLVTATAKLNRQELESKFKDQLEQAADGEGSEGGGGDDNHERRDKADRNTTRAGKQER